MLLTNQDTFFCPKGVLIREVPTKHYHISTGINLPPSLPISTGINTPALFRECLHVLRGIVITAIKSGNKESDGSPSPVTSPVTQSVKNSPSGTVHRVGTNHVSTTMVAGQNGTEKSDSRKRSKRRESRGRDKESESHGGCTESVITSTPVYPHTVTSSQSSHSSTPSPTAHLHTLTSTPSRPHTSQLATPLPASRLSSGIGSLQEEEGGGGISGFKQITKEKDAIHSSKNSSLVADARKSSNCKGKDETHRLTNSSGLQQMQSELREKSSQAPTETWARRVAQRHAGPSEGIAKSPQVSSVPSNRDPSISLHSHTPQLINSTLTTTSPPHPHPMDSPHTNILSHNTSLNSPLAGGISPRTIQQLQEGMERLQTSRAEKDKLSDDVQLLSLRVKEEELK